MGISTDWSDPAKVSTNWDSPTKISTNWSAELLSLSGIIMDDTVCKMEDSTYTMDDTKNNPSVVPVSTDWA